MMNTSSFSSSAVETGIDTFHHFVKHAATETLSGQEDFAELDTGFSRYFGDIPMPILNGVIQLPENVTALDSKMIQQQLEYFNQKGFPHIWWLTTEKQHDAFGPLLEQEGYAFMGDYQVFAADAKQISLDQLPKMPKDSPVTVHEVQTDKEYEDFCGLFSQIFGLDEISQNKFVQILKDYGQNKPYRHIYAKTEGKIVGVMSLHFAHHWCSVWNGGVDIPYRRLGVGRALCIKAAEILNAQPKVEGVVALLMGEAQAMALCKKFGAERMGAIYPYIYGLNAHEFEPQ